MHMKFSDLVFLSTACHLVIRRLRYVYHWILHVFAFLTL